MTFGSGPVVMMLIAGSTSISTSSCDADTLTRSWLSSVVLTKTLMGGDGGEQRGVELCPGPAEGDQGVVADPGDDPRLAPAGEQACGLVVDGGCGAERGCGDEGAVAGEVVAQQRHSPAGLAEDVARLDGHAVEVQLAPRPSGQARRVIRWRDSPSARASMTAAVSRPSGAARKTQKTAASVRRLIQVLVPVTSQVPLPAWVARVAVA